MPQESVLPFCALNETQKTEAVAVLVDGFGHQFTFAKTKDELMQLFFSSLNEPQIYAYVEENHVYGVLGLATNTQRALKVDRSACIAIFGNFKGKMVYAILHKMASALAVEKDTDLYIDYLATSPDARRRGCATKLLNFAFSLPAYNDCYLDVLSKNTGAAKLYEKMGFGVYKKEFNIFALLKGLGQPIMLKKCVR